MATPGAAAKKHEFNPDLSGQPRVKREALIEIVCLVLLIETIMWLVPFLPNQRTAYAALSSLIIVLLVTCHLRDQVNAREIGLRFDNFFGVLARLALPLVAVVIIALATGLAAGSLRFGAKFYSMLAAVPLWALLQQYMLLVFCNRRLRVIVGEKRCRVATAALFSLLHLPNPVLVIACAAGGYLWAREYERSPNLFANALTHTLASAFLANTLPGWLLKNMVVGYNYFLR
jgi:hypothetical protein